MAIGAICLFVWLARAVPRYIANRGIRHREKEIEAERLKIQEETERLSNEIEELKAKLK